jgi:opacity protein-like surface antigen
MRKCIWLFGLLIIASFSTAAQDFSRAEVFGMYTYSRSYNSNGDTSSANGGSGDVAFFPSKMWGVVANVGGASSNGYTNSSGTHFNSTSSTFHYLFGPRVRFGNDRITPFVETLLGGSHRSNVTLNGATLVAAQTSFDLTAGGGVDFKVTKNISIRAIRIDYSYTRFTPPGVQNTQNGLGISTGVGFTW